MKKLSIFTLSIICCTFCYAEGILMHNGKTYSVDTLSYSHIIGPSTRYACYRLPDYPMVIYLTEVDLTNPHIELEGCLGKDKAFGEECPTEMAARHNTPGHEVIAVTNGDFYFYQSSIIYHMASQEAGNLLIMNVLQILSDVPVSF